MAVGTGVRRDPVDAATRLIELKLVYLRARLSAARWMVWGKLRVAYSTAYMATCKNRLPVAATSECVLGVGAKCQRRMLRHTIAAPLNCQLFTLISSAHKHEKPSTPSSDFPPAQLGIRREGKRVVRHDRGSRAS
jgi:hypothetical protein